MALKNVETNTAIAVDVRMEDFRVEFHHWRFEWIVRWEFNRQAENAALVGTIGGAHYRRSPMDEVALFRAGGTLGGRIGHQGFQFLISDGNTVKMKKWRRKNQPIGFF